jgi:hypothetical protein
MRKKILIKGDFELEGDVPCLEMTTGRFSFVELELEYNPVVKMTQFKGIPKIKSKNNEIRALLEKIKLKGGTKKSILKVLDIIEDDEMEMMFKKIKELNSP